MDEHKYIITFDNGSVADANRWASELKEYILDATDDAEVEQQRDNLHSQDLGATLSLVLGSPAVAAVAQALGNWLMKHRGADISIRTPQGEIVATNLSSKNVVKLAEMLLATSKAQE